MQGGVGAQQTGVGEAPRSGDHREQKGREGLHWIDRIGRTEREWQMLPHRFAMADPPQNPKNTTKPPNGVTVRWVSRNFIFSRPKER